MQKILQFPGGESHHGKGLFHHDLKIGKFFRSPGNLNDPGRHIRDGSGGAGKARRQQNDEQFLFHIVCSVPSGRR